jgi:hypothetical protein
MISTYFEMVVAVSGEDRNVGVDVYIDRPVPPSSRALAGITALAPNQARYRSGEPAAQLDSDWDALLRTEAAWRSEQS